METFLVPELVGGLGNQMFILASVWAFARRHGLTMEIYRRFITDTCLKHSSRDYFQTMFSKLVVNDSDPPHIVQSFRDGLHLPGQKGHFLIQNYLQDYRHFDMFYDILKTDLFNITSTPPLAKTCFVHFRRGDYLQPPHESFHNVVTHEYYQKAMTRVREQFPSAIFLIFSDDIPFVSTQIPWIHKYHPIEFVHEKDELVELSMMIHCELGGITANSTFSWWGAYLNKHRPIFIMPSRWFSDPTMPIDGYFFDNVVVI